MSTVNRVILIGNLGKDPEVKQLGTGTTVCNFPIATEYQAQGGASKTSWHQITAWSKTGEACAKSLKKGSKVCIEGRIDYQEFAGKDGTKQYRTAIVADKVTFLSSVAKEQPVVSATPSWAPQANEDLPF